VSSKRSVWRLGYDGSFHATPLDTSVAPTTVRAMNYDFLTGLYKSLDGTPLDTLPASLFASGRPNFFGTNAWPWVTPESTTKLATLPAKARYDAGTPMAAMDYLPTAMEIISRSVPATASAGNAAYAQGMSYAGPLWGGQVCQLAGDGGNATGGWLVYDLSGVLADKRQNVLVALATGKGDQYYQSNFRNANYPAGYTDSPLAYVLEGATSAAGPWTALLTEPTNCNQFKTHALNLAGYTFLRFRVTDGSNGCFIKMDVYNAAGGVTDGVAWYGDSILTNAFSGGTYPQEWFSKGVQALAPGYFPAIAGGGYPFITASDAVSLVTLGTGGFAAGLPAPLMTILDDAKYAFLAYGTNDAAADSLVSAYRASMTTIINALRAQGQTVCLACPPWSADPNRITRIPKLRATLGFWTPAWVAGTFAAGDYVWNLGRGYQCAVGGTSVSGPTGTGTSVADGGTATWTYLPTLREDYQHDPQVMAGPDLYSAFLNHPEWLDTQGVHPSGTGSTVYRNTWISWAATILYAPTVQTGGTFQGQVTSSFSGYVRAPGSVSATLTGIVAIATGNTLTVDQPIDQSNHAWPVDCSGSADPGAIVMVWNVDGGLIGQATADASGIWAFTVATA
jgi:hypothetical protein